MSLLQFLTAAERCKNAVYAGVAEDYQSHVNFITEKWDDGYGTVNLLKYDKAMRQRFAESPERGFPPTDTDLVFKYLITTPSLIFDEQDHCATGAAGSVLRREACGQWRLQVRRKWRRKVLPCAGAACGKCLRGRKDPAEAQVGGRAGGY